MIAVIEIYLEPTLRLGEFAVRWQTLALTGAILLGLVVAALRTGGRQGWRWRPRAAGERLFDPRGASARETLSVEDLLLVVGGSIPLALIGGRLAHGLAFSDYYASDPWRLLDPSVGSLSLLGAIVGALVGGAYIARLLATPILRWADLAAVPLLLVIGLGKLAQFTGGSGQGLPFDGPWAVAFVGDGPWVSNAPDTPSHPSQLYEAAWMLLGIPLILWFAGPRRTPSRVHRWVAWADRAGESGRLFAAAAAWFLVGRFVIGFTWRDDKGAFGVSVEQALAMSLLLPIVAVWVTGVVLRREAAESAQLS